MSDTRGDQTLKAQLLAKECVWLLTAMFFGALYIVSAVNPARMDADIIVSTLASLKNPTLYYWGQDRLFSLIPMMLLPFRNIEWNLYCNTFFHATFFCALILIILRSMPGNKGNTFLLLLAVLIVLNHTIPAPELFTFTKHAQPYAASTVFMFLAFFIYYSTIKHINWKRKKPICAVLVVISLLLNPLTLMLGLGLFLAELIASMLHSSAFSGRNMTINLRWLSILLSSFFIALLTKKIYCRNYDITATNLDFNIANFTPALKITASRFIESFNGNYTALGSVVFGFIICVYTCLGRRNNLIIHGRSQADITAKQILATSARPSFHEVISRAAIINLLTLLPIISSEWYRMNDYSLRYIFPLYLVIIIGLCTPLNYIFSLLSTDRISYGAKANNDSPRKLRNSIISLALASCIAAISIGSYRPLVPSLMTYNDFSRVQPVYNSLLNSLYTSENIFIGGSYWLSWPFKGLGMRDGYDIGVITDRSRFDPVSKQRESILDNHIRMGDEFTFICLSEDRSATNCESFLKDKIHSNSTSPRDWKMDILGKPMYYSFNGDIYATKLQYKIP